MNYMIGNLNTRLYEHTQHVADHNGWQVLRVIIEFLDKPPDNAKFQMDMKLNQLIQDKEGKSIICKTVRDVMNMIQTSEKATVQYRRSVGSSSDQGQLKMLVWTLRDPDTKLELTRDRMDQPHSLVDGKVVEKTYARVCRTIRVATTSITPAQ